MAAKGLPVLRWLQATFGGALAMSRPKTERWDEAWRWTICGGSLRPFLVAVRPHAILKRNQVELALEMLSMMGSKHHRPKWTPDMKTRAAEIRTAVMAANRKGPPPLPRLPPGALAMLADGHWMTGQQDLFSRSLTAFSATLPRWGSMRNGALWERTMPALPTSGTGCSFWPTPDASVSNGFNQSPSEGAAVRPHLSAMARQWPTPQAHDAMAPKTPEQIAAMKARAPARTGGGTPGVSNLNEAAAKWPTPSARDGDASTETHQQGTTLTDAAVRLGKWATPRSSDGAKGGPNMAFGAGGEPLPTQAARWPTPMAGIETRTAPGGIQLDQAARIHSGEPPSHPGQKIARAGKRTFGSTRVLNPLFVEALMAWPIGWSACDCSAMELCPLKPLSRGESSTTDCAEVA